MCLSNEMTHPIHILFPSFFKYNSTSPAASKPQMTGLHEGLGPCNASARNRCASYPARRHAIAANCLALVIAPRCSEQPTRIINLPDRPTQNSHVKFDVWTLEMRYKPIFVQKAAAWSSGSRPIRD